MRDGRGIYLRVGLLLVIGLAVLVGLVLFLTGAQFSHGKLYESYFRESVQGLDVGAPVKYRGVTLGRVTDIGLVSAEYGRNVSDADRSAMYQLVFVRFIVDTRRVGRVVDTETLVKNGLRARLGSQGLTGLSYLELDFVSPNRYPALNVPWHPLADYIPSMPSTLTQVQDAAQVLLSRIEKLDIDQLASNAQGLITDLRADLKEGDVHQTLVAATAALQAITEGLKSADLPGLTAELRGAASSVRNVAEGKQTQDLLASANAAVNRMSAVASQLPPLIAALQQTVRRTDNSSADIQQALVPVLRDIQATVANLRELSQALRQSPSQALFGAPPPRNSGNGR